MKALSLPQKLVHNIFHICVDCGGSRLLSSILWRRRMRRQAARRQWQPTSSSATRRSAHSVVVVCCVARRAKSFFWKLARIVLLLFLYENTELFSIVTSGFRSSTRLQRNIARGLLTLWLLRTFVAAAVLRSSVSRCRCCVILASLVPDRVRSEVRDR